MLWDLLSVTYVLRLVATCEATCKVHSAVCRRSGPFGDRRVTVHANELSFISASERIETTVDRESSTRRSHQSISATHQTVAEAILLSNSSSRVM